MAWDHSQVNGTLIFKGTFSITIRFINRDNNSNWACNSVYVPNERTLRSDFWNEVRLVKNLLSIPWAIYEDFNTTFNLEDKNKGYSKYLRSSFTWSPLHQDKQAN